MFCIKCGEKLQPEAIFCGNCGHELDKIASEPAVAAEHGTRQDILPEEFRKWNWGAFTFTFIWGFGNRTYSALWCFVPVVGLVMPFILGAKGNEWAWKNKQWESLDVFIRAQKTWAKAALYFLVFSFLLGLAIAFTVDI